MAVPAMVPTDDLVDRDLGGDALGDPGDGFVVFEASQEDGVRSSARRVGEIELERVAVQPGCGSQVRKAGAEDRRPAQRHDRQHRTEQGAPHRNGSPHRSFAPARYGHRSPRSAVHPSPPSGSPPPRGAKRLRRSSVRKASAARRAGHMPRTSTTATVASAPSKRTGVSKATPGRVLGDARLAERSDRREHGGDRHRADGTDQPHHQGLRHAERHQLTPIGAEGRHRRVVLALDDALAGQCLADDRQSDQSGERSQDPPPDGLGMDGCLDGDG